MSSVVLSFVLDIVVLVCLGMTIYFALRLSKSLNNFRAHRKEMKALINDLSRNIEQAQNAIGGLREAGRSTGAELQDLINESRTLSDELQIMNESGNSLAERLQSLAEGSRRAIQGVDDNIPAQPARKRRQPTGGGGPSFLIQDRDFDDGDDIFVEDDPWDNNDQDTEVLDAPDDLKSQAERELYQALQRNQKKKSAGG